MTSTALEDLEADGRRRRAAGRGPLDVQQRESGEQREDHPQLEQLRAHEGVEAVPGRVLLGDVTAREQASSETRRSGSGSAGSTSKLGSFSRRIAHRPARQSAPWRARAPLQYAEDRLGPQMLMDVDRLHVATTLRKVHKVDGDYVLFAVLLLEHRDEPTRRA